MNNNLISKYHIWTEVLHYLITLTEYHWRGAEKRQSQRSCVIARHSETPTWSTQISKSPYNLRWTREITSMTLALSQYNFPTSGGDYTSFLLARRLIPSLFEERVGSLCSATELISTFDDNKICGHHAVTTSMEIWLVFSRRKRNKGPVG